MTYRFRTAAGLVLLLVGWQAGSPLGPFGADSTAADGKKQAPPLASAAPQEKDKGERLLKPAPKEPPRPEALEGAIRRGVAFLLKDQNKDGSWGSASLRGGVELYAPVPGAHQAFRAAVTALAVCALIETGGDSVEVRRSLERGEAWLLEHLAGVRRANADTIYNVWTHAYGIQALVRMHGRLPGDAERHRRIVELIRHQIGMLQRYESIDGGWGYYDFRAGTQRPASSATSFTTAAALIALHEAREIGVAAPEPLVKRAIAAVRRQRRPDFAYIYDEDLKWSPLHPINQPGGSLGRSQCCNVALRCWGDAKITDKVLASWLDRLFARNLWLDMGRKRPIPHESHFYVAGYFFYFGHYYAARAVELLPRQERSFYQDHLAHVLLRLQSKDGSWWDFPMYNYHQQYGTAFALMSLKRCQHLPAVSRPKR
jgi:hypothetical protein